MSRSSSLTLADASSSVAPDVRKSINRRRNSGIQEEARRLRDAHNLMNLGFPLPVCLDALQRFQGDHDKAAEMLLQEKALAIARPRVASREDNIQPLVAMGFPRSWAQKALDESNDDTEVAARWILSNHSRLQAGTTGKSLDPTVLSLVDMGFHREESIVALKNCDGDIYRAADLLARKSKKENFQKDVVLPRRSTSPRNKLTTPRNKLTTPRNKQTSPRNKQTSTTPKQMNVLNGMSPRNKPPRLSTPIVNGSSPMNGYRRKQEEEEFAIVVPEGSFPGQQLVATAPSGRSIQVIVPPNAKPGALPRQVKSSNDGSNNKRNIRDILSLKELDDSDDGKNLVYLHSNLPVRDPRILPAPMSTYRSLSNEAGMSPSSSPYPPGVEDYIENEDLSSSDSDRIDSSINNDWDPDVFRQLPEVMQKELLKQRNNTVNKKMNNQFKDPPKYSEKNRTNKNNKRERREGFYPPAYSSSSSKNDYVSGFSAADVTLPALPSSLPQALNRPRLPSYEEAIRAQLGVSSTVIDKKSRKSRKTEGKDVISRASVMEDVPEWYVWFHNLSQQKQDQISALSEEHRRKLFERRPDRRLKYLMASTAHDDDQGGDPTQDLTQLDLLIRPVSGEGWSRRIITEGERLRRKSEPRSRLDRVLGRHKNEDGSEGKSGKLSGLKSKIKDKIIISPENKRRSRRIWTSPMRFFKGQTERQVLLDKLRDYDGILRDELQRRQALWEQLKATMGRADEEAIAESRLLLSWGISDQVILRTLERRQLLRMQRHAALQQIHHSAGAILAARSREVGAFVNTLNSNTSIGRGGAPLPVIGNDFFVDPAQLIARDSGTLTKKEFMANLAGRLREADKAVAKLKPLLMPKSYETRRVHLQNTVIRTVDSVNEKGDKVAPPVDSQALFNSIVSDVRTPQGRMWRRWHDAFLSTLDPNVPEASYNPLAVVTFVDYFAEVLAYDFEIEDDDIHILALHALVEGLVYPELRPLCMEFNRTESREMDKTWRHQLMWIRDLSMAQIGVDRKFARNDKEWKRSFGSVSKSFRASMRSPDVSPRSPLYVDFVPFQNACDLMTEFATGQVPGLMINALLLAIKSIHDEAATIVSSDPKNKKETMTAEYLLPLIVWVAVHANMPSIHSALAFTEKFGGRCNKGEAAYYLCSLQSAVLFVTKMNKSQICDVDSGDFECVKEMSIISEDDIAIDEVEGIKQVVSNRTVELIDGVNNLVIDEQSKNDGYESSNSEEEELVNNRRSNRRRIEDVVPPIPPKLMHDSVEDDTAIITESDLIEESTENAMEEINKSCSPSND